MEFRLSCVVLTFIILNIIEVESTQSYKKSASLPPILHIKNLPSASTELPLADEPPLQPVYPLPYLWPLYQFAGNPVPISNAPESVYPPQQVPLARTYYYLSYEPQNTPQISPPHYFQPQEVIHLGSQNEMTPPCATILTSSKCILRVSDDGYHHDLKSRDFVFAAGDIKEQCSLTVQDCTGSYSTMDYMFDWTGNPCNTVASVCCECNGCSRGNFPVNYDSCASLFENARCSTCKGFRLEVLKGDNITTMDRLIDNQVSSVYVRPGCELWVFKEPHFQGDAAIATGSIDELPPDWNDVISSYQCSCLDDNNSNVTTTTTTPRPTPPITNATLAPPTTPRNITTHPPTTTTIKTTQATTLKVATTPIATNPPTTERPTTQVPTLTTSTTKLPTTERPTTQVRPLSTSTTKLPTTDEDVTY